MGIMTDLRSLTLMGKDTKIENREYCVLDYVLCLGETDKDANSRKGFAGMGESDVARLRRQIEMELEAMQRGMLDFAVGTARHDFIRARLEHIVDYQDKLAEHIGDAD